MIMINNIRNYNDLKGSGLAYKTNTAVSGAPKYFSNKNKISLVGNGWSQNYPRNSLTKREFDVRASRFNMYKPSHVMNVHRLFTQS